MVVDVQLRPFEVVTTCCVVVQPSADLNVIDAELILVAVYVEAHEQQLQAAHILAMSPHNDPAVNIPGTQLGAFQLEVRLVQHPVALLRPDVHTRRSRNKR